jgi:hypothetical protein
MRNDDRKLLHDYLSFSAGLIIGGLIIGIFDAFRYDKKVKASYKRFKRSSIIIYTPPQGIDLKRGIRL